MSLILTIIITYRRTVILCNGQHFLHFQKTLKIIKKLTNVPLLEFKPKYISKILIHKMTILIFLHLQNAPSPKTTQRTIKVVVCAKTSKALTLSSANSKILQ